MNKRTTYSRLPVWILGCFLLACTASAQEYEFVYEGTIGGPPAVGDPYGLTVSPSGEIFLADRGNGRILKITKEGNLKSQDYKALELGSPAALAIDRKGDLLVLDQENGRLLHVADRVRSLAEMGALKSEGGFSALAGLAMDRSGAVYVSDQATNEIYKIQGGEIEQTIGGEGSEPGRFHGPRGLAVDRRGNLYVADEFNNRIQKFAPNGEFLGQSGPETLGRTLSSGLGPMDVAVDSQGGIWVAAHTNFALYKLDQEFRLSVRLDSFGLRDGQVIGPVSVAVDAADNVYALDRSRRIQKFDRDGNFLWKYQLPAAGPAEFSAPTGVGFDPEGNFWVSDTANFRIQKFDRSGRFIMSFGEFGNGVGQFNGVESLDFDAEGNLYVVDSHNSRVQKFDNQGRSITTWGSWGTGPGEFQRTKVIEVKNEAVYVNDWHNNRTQKFDLKGNFLLEFGNRGARETQVLGPTGLAVGDDGHVYVSSWYNNRIQVFTSQGKYVRSIGKEGTGPCEFNGPARLDMDGSGNLVVADWGNSRIQVISPRGDLVSSFGKLGAGEGQFNQPVGVAVDSEGRVFVSDASNSRVQMFSRSLGSPRSPVSEVEEASDGVYAQVTIYDIHPEAREEFEAALNASGDLYRRESSFVNERLLSNVDPLSPQYASYARFRDLASARRTLKERLARVREYCRREPESHVVRLTRSYFPEGITLRPTGLEYGGEQTGQIAHLGLFIPIPHYRQEYDRVLHETKTLTRGDRPKGYMGEDLMVEVQTLLPEQQTPYSPRPPEPSRMSINYGEYETLENAEDSYISRQRQRDPKLVSMERIFFSSLQVPTRFFIFKVIGNYNGGGEQVADQTIADL